MTLAEARDQLRDLVDEGATCPCCRQYARVYRRKIHATMARTLCRVYRAAPSGEWVHLPSLAGYQVNDFPKLRYWGLVEEEIELRRDDGGRAGYWRITPQGWQWVLIWTTVPKYARIYDGRCLGLEGDPVTVLDALGDRFDYRELMEGE